MKCSFCLLAVCIALLPFAAVSQSWEPFPLGQKSYFEKQNGPLTEVEMLVMDSVRVWPGHEVLYFGKKPYTGGAGDCFNVALDTLLFYGLSSYDLSAYAGHLLRDSLMQHADTIFYYWGYSATPFYFITTAQPGDEWTVTSDYPMNDYDQITITCSAAAVETFLGVTDSIRIYTMTANGNSLNQTPIDSFRIVLSKSHGLVEFVPFRQFLYHPASSDFSQYKLVGIDNGIQYGFVPPTFADYFHLNASDVLMWKEESDPDWLMLPTTIWYHRDSIVSSLITPDSVVYVFNRITFDSVPTYHPGLQRTFTRADYANIVEAPSYSVGFGLGGSTQLVWRTSAWSTGIDTASGEPRVSRWFHNELWQIDTITCTFTQYYDNTLTFSVNTIAGLMSECWNSFGTHCKYLIGHIISGEASGVLEFPTSAEQVSKIHLATHLVPNPTSGSIKLSGVHTGIAFVTFCDPLGRLVKTQTVYDDAAVNINGLVNGLYYYRILSAQKEIIGQGKIALQR